MDQVKNQDRSAEEQYYNCAETNIKLVAQIQEDLSQIMNLLVERDSQNKVLKPEDRITNTLYALHMLSSQLYSYAHSL